MVIDNMKKKGISFYKEVEKNHNLKIMQYIIMISHEFGHILYNMGYLNEEKNIIDKYINSGIAFGHHDLDERLYLWEGTLNVVENMTWEKIKERKINIIDEELEKIKFKDFFSHDGQKDSLSFFKKIKNNNRIKEELTCDLFAYRFVKDVLDLELNDFYPNLVKLQIFMTLTGYLFENKSLSNNIDSFIEGFSRFIIMPGLSKENNTNIIYDNDLLDFLKISYMFSKYNKLYPSFTMFELMMDDKKYKEISNELYNDSLIYN